MTLHDSMVFNELHLQLHSSPAILDGYQSVRCLPSWLQTELPCGRLEGEGPALAGDARYQQATALDEVQLEHSDDGSSGSNH